MRALLHNLVLTFESEDAAVLAGWRALFDLEAAAASPLPEHTTADISLVATTVSHIPPAPAGRPSYRDKRAGEGWRAVRYYETAAGGILDLARPAQIHFDFDAGQARIYLTQNVVDTGNLEDITMIALAPFLRRRGFYMAHAFTVAGEMAVLLSGPSGSGKSTTGLALIAKGWKYLANDVTLVRRDQGAVNAYPSPGAINLHPHTLAILPAYQERLSPDDTAESSGKYVLSRGALLVETQLSRLAPVSAVLFPTISDQKEPALITVPPAVGMARLVEEGVDQWDKATYENHLNLLAALSRQAQFYDLRLPHSDLTGVAPLTEFLNQRLFGASA